MRFRLVEAENTITDKEKWLYKKYPNLESLVNGCVNEEAIHANPNLLRRILVEHGSDPNKNLCLFIALNIKEVTTTNMSKAIPIDEPNVKNQKSFNKRFIKGFLTLIQVYSKRNDYTLTGSNPIFRCSNLYDRNPIDMEYTLYVCDIFYDESKRSKYLNTDDDKITEKLFHHGKNIKPAGYRDKNLSEDTLYGVAEKYSKNSNSDIQKRTSTPKKKEYSNKLIDKSVKDDVQNEISKVKTASSSKDIAKILNTALDMLD